MIDSSNKLVKDYGREYKEGDILFSEGEKGTELFIIEKGTVEISKVVKGEKKVIASLGEGDFFGEMSLVSETARTATAKVLEDSVIVAIDEETFEDTVAKDASILYLILKKVCHRLKETTDALAEKM